MTSTIILIAFALLASSFQILFASAVQLIIFRIAHAR
jgi:hypothetical protein